MISREELRRMYHDEGMTQLEIAHIVGVTDASVSLWMKKCGIESRTGSEAKLGDSVKPSEKELRQMYCDKQMSSTKIANKVGVTPFTIFNWMQEYGIDPRTVSESKLGNLVKSSKNELEEMYLKNHMSMSGIADEIGVFPGTICKWMKEYEIESRTNSESLVGRFVGEKSGNWQGGTSFKSYCRRFNNAFKELVRARDDYTCQLCGLKQSGRKLDVHHVHYDKENCYPDVVVLCRSCNGKVNSNRDYWEQYFENQLIERGLYCWSINDIVA